MTETPAEPQALDAECPICHGPVTIEYIKHGQHTIVGYEEWTETIYRAASRESVVPADHDTWCSLNRDAPEAYHRGASCACFCHRPSPHNQWLEDVPKLNAPDLLTGQWHQWVKVEDIDARLAAAHPQDPPEPPVSDEACIGDLSHQYHSHDDDPEPPR